MSAERRPTITTVAARAGVSKSLVSLVLQGSTRVGDESRQRVLRAIDELGYRPNSSARTLAANRSNVVGVVLSSLRNPWHADFLDGFRETLRTAGKQIVLGDCDRDVAKLADAVDSLLEMRAEALVFVGEIPASATIEQCASEVPVVIIGTREHNAPFASLFANDDAVGARLAADHLADLGHVDIAQLAGTNVIGRIRRQAFTDRIVERGLPKPVTLSGELTESVGRDLAEQLFDTHPSVTAVFAANDLLAVGVLTAMAERGLLAPDDVSLIGYDNTSLAQLGPISLTSIDIAAHGTGIAAGRHLLSRLQGAPVETKLIQPSLVTRRSTNVARESTPANSERSNSVPGSLSTRTTAYQPRQTSASPPKQRRAR